MARVRRGGGGGGETGGKRHTSMARGSTVRIWHGLAAAEDIGLQQYANIT